MTVKQNGILLKEDGKYTKDAAYFTEEEIVNGDSSFFMGQHQCGTFWKKQKSLTR